MIDRLASAGPLETLGRGELDLDHSAVTTDPKPEKVRAWVRFGGAPIRVDAEACMWTVNAVAIRFTSEEKEFRCWVWRGAVEGWDPPRR